MLMSVATDFPEQYRTVPEEDEKQDRGVFFGWKQGDPPSGLRFRAMMEWSRPKILR
jgi:hypothetical protein